MKKSYKIFLFFLLIFSIYCSLIIGRSWDEDFHLYQGKITLNYLFSLGQNDKLYIYREFYSPIYWTLNYFISQIFPYKYQIEVNHIVNLFFSFL